MQTSTILVTVHGPLKTIDLELPGDVPISELIPLLLEICGSQKNSSQEVVQAPVSLQVEGMGVSLPMNKTLIDVDIYDGVVLLLQMNQAPSIQAESPTPRLFAPRSVQPSPDTGGIGITWKIPGAS